MDARKKILLGNKDILSRELKDFYIDVNLSVDSKEIIPYKYDNVFDLTKFYEQERNGSRNFIIYGTIDSYSWDCNNLKISVYQSPDLRQENLLCTVNSENIVNNNMPFNNIYNKLRGKYIINSIPPTFTGYSVFLKIETVSPATYATYVIEQQLIFTTLTLTNTNEKIVEQLKYGLDEAVTDCDGNVIEVNNNFDFFYNKHWINKNLYFINDSKMWIGNEDTKTCEMSSELFRGRNIGTYNTGNYMFGEIKEVYQVNKLPTGNKEINIPESTHYIAPFSSSGACYVLPEYTFELGVNVLTNTSGNTSSTAPTDGLEIIATPSDTLFKEGEQITVSNISISPYWEFYGYYTNRVGQVYGKGDSVDITANTFSFNIHQNTVIRAAFKEIVPYTIEYTSFWYDNNGINHDFGTYMPLYNISPITLSPKREAYYHGESVMLTVYNVTLDYHFVNWNGITFKLTALSINGVPQVVTNEPGIFQSEFNFPLEMIENKVLVLIYNQM